MTELMKRYEMETGKSAIDPHEWECYGHEGEKFHSYEFTAWLAKQLTTPRQFRAKIYVWDDMDEVEAMSDTAVSKRVDIPRRSWVEAMSDTAVKRGERVLVWDDPISKFECTYVQTVEGGKEPYCVVLEEQTELAAFSNGKTFAWVTYSHMSRIPKRK